MDVNLRPDSGRRRRPLSTVSSQTALLARGTLPTGAVGGCLEECGPGAQPFGNRFTNGVATGSRCPGDGVFPRPSDSVRRIEPGHHGKAGDDGPGTADATPTSDLDRRARPRPLMQCADLPDSQVPVARQEEVGPLDPLARPAQLSFMAATSTAGPQVPNSGTGPSGSGRHRPRPRTHEPSGAECHPPAARRHSPSHAPYPPHGTVAGDVGTPAAQIRGVEMATSPRLLGPASPRRSRSFLIAPSATTCLHSDPRTLDNDEIVPGT